jgi:VWFA-related protein
MRFGALSLLVATLVAQSSQPTFRSRLDLLRVDVTVVDNAGAPIRDLGASDFLVTVDGQPRPVSFARFYGPKTAQPAADAPPSFADNTTTTTVGRVVILVADLESITPGSEKVFFETAGSLIDRLGPEDSVGLILVPGRGIELTPDHARVRKALADARGSASPKDRDHAITMREAEGFFRSDPVVIRAVTERECRPDERTCPNDLDREAHEILNDADQHIRHLVATLTELNTRIAHIDAPRTVVVLSAGLPYRQELDSYFRDLKRRSAESGTTTYIVQLYQPDTDASQQGKPGTRTLPGTDLAEGLSSLAGATDGSIHFGVGRAQGVFDRIQTEIVHTYQLGVESVPADGDGKAHTIEVHVTRPAAVVRTRREFVISRDATPVRTVADAMAFPPGLAETPLSIGVYNTRGQDATTLKLVVLLESVTGIRPAAAPSFAFEITSTAGKPAFQANGKMKVQSDRAVATVAAQVAPGRYSLRGAIVTAEGRAGSVEFPITVGMRQAAEYQFSDLIVGTLADGFTPTSRIGPPSATTLLELYTADPARFEGVTVDLELRNGDRTLAAGAATLAAGSFEQQRVAQGTLKIPDLGPGAYQLIAVVKRNGQPVAHLARTVVHPPPAPRV